MGVIIILVFHTDVQSMLRQLATLGVASSAIFAQPSVNPINVECNGDNTLDVSIDYDREAEILDFEYGSCTKDNVGRANLTQQSDFGWKFTLDVDSCNMNDKLRTLKYNQTMSVRVGKKSQAMELTLANFEVDSYCTYTAAYKVKFDYGSLEAETVSFASDAGLINLTFAIKSYNANFSAEQPNSEQAGEIINLGLTVVNDNFDHAQNASSKTGKIFAPKKCVVSDERSQTYTIFDYEADDCQNQDIDFTIAFSEQQKMWQFSHILFLLGDYRTSKLSLTCDVIVCDKQKSGDCDAVVKACLKPVVGNECVDKAAQWKFTVPGQGESVGCNSLFFDLEASGDNGLEYIANTLQEACKETTLVGDLSSVFGNELRTSVTIVDADDVSQDDSNLKFVDVCQSVCANGVDYSSISSDPFNFTPVNPSGCSAPAGGK